MHSPSLEVTQNRATFHDTFSVRGADCQRGVTISLTLYDFFRCNTSQPRRVTASPLMVVRILLALSTMAVSPMNIEASETSTICALFGNPMSSRT